MQRNNPELDQWGRVKDLHYKNGGSATVHRYQHAHDKHGNRLFARVTQASGHDNDRSWRYAYDGLNRLTGADHGALTSNNSVIQDAYANKSTWQLDNLGNWSGGANDDSFTSSIDTDGDGVADSTATLHHNTDLTNAIDTLVANGSPAIQFINDQAGNLVFDGTLVYRYDAWNRLVAVNEVGTVTIDEYGHIDDPGNLGVTVATLRYGPLGRLITYENATLTEHYYYDGVRRIQTIEDNGVALSTQSEYVYGPDYVDEFILQTRNTGGGTFQTMYMLQDANYNVVALTDGSGNVLEQYAWEPYGTQAAMDTLATPAPDNRVGHQGLFYYSFGNTGLYYNRNRWYSPTLGRFTTKDPNGTSQVVTRMMMLARLSHALSFPSVFSSDALFADGLNLYSYARTNSVGFTDPMGLALLLDTLDSNFMRGSLYASTLSTAGSVMAYIQGVAGAAQAYGFVMSISALAGYYAALGQVDQALYPELINQFSRLAEDAASRKDEFIQGMRDWMNNNGGSPGGRGGPPDWWNRFQHTMKHAKEFFGTNDLTQSQMREWGRMIDYASRSGNTFSWSSRGSQTVAHLVKLPSGHWFCVQYYQVSGELATAFVPNSAQLNAMLQKMGG